MSAPLPKIDEAVARELKREWKGYPGPELALGPRQQWWGTNGLRYRVKLEKLQRERETPHE